MHEQGKQTATEAKASAQQETTGSKHGRSPSAEKNHPQEKKPSLIEKVKDAVGTGST